MPSPQSPARPGSVLRPLLAGALLALALPAAATAQGTGSAARRDTAARDTAARHSARDSASVGPAARDTLPRGAMVRVRSLGDSAVRITIVGESIARDTTFRELIARLIAAADSAAVDSATRAALAGEPAVVARRDPAEDIARRVDSLASEAARELGRARAAAIAAEVARRDSIELARAERIAHVRARSAWAPKRPRQGALVRLVLPKPPGSASWRAAEGTLAGEPLHFEPEADGTLAAIGAIPVTARTDSIVARLVLVTAAGDVDSLALAIPVDSGDFRSEKLRVSRTYGTEPDSALQARIDREYELAVAVSRKSHETPRLWRGKWVVPREARVTSGFGNAREFNGVVTSRHMGVDYAGPAGAPVRAANRGVVALVGDFFLGGNVVYLDHGAGLVTAYLHLSRVDVAQGDTVEAGERIGLVGSTGRSTGPHLHWIARYGGVSVDARGLLSLPARKEEPAKPE